MGGGRRKSQTPNTALWPLPETKAIFSLFVICMCLFVYVDNFSSLFFPCYCCSSECMRSTLQFSLQVTGYSPGLRLRGVIPRVWHGLKDYGTWCFLEKSENFFTCTKGSCILAGKTYMAHCMVVQMCLEKCIETWNIQRGGLCLIPSYCLSSPNHPCLLGCHWRA